MSSYNIDRHHVSEKKAARDSTLWSMMSTANGIRLGLQMIGMNSLCEL